MIGRCDGCGTEAKVFPYGKAITPRLRKRLCEGCLEPLEDARALALPPGLTLEQQLAAMETVGVFVATRPITAQEAARPQRTIRVAPASGARVKTLPR